MVEGVGHHLFEHRRLRYAWFLTEVPEVELHSDGLAKQQHPPMLAFNESCWVVASSIPCTPPPLRFVVCMDNDATVRMVNGDSRILEPSLVEIVPVLQDRLGDWHRRGRLYPWHPCLPFVRHVSRDNNSLANSLANRAYN